MSDAAVDVRLLGEQVKRMMDSLGTLKTDFDVAAAILRRLDLTQGALLDEIRGVHAQQQRIGARLSGVEDRFADINDKLGRILALMETEQ